MSDIESNGLPGASGRVIRNGRSVVIDRLASGESVFALGVRYSRSVEIVKIARTAGCGVLWVDLEHAAMSIETATQICSAALDAGLIPMARIPANDLGVIGKLLNSGVLGILAPRVETAAQAEQVVSACRFPPNGIRSQIGAISLFDYEKLPARHLNRFSNQATFVAIMVESEKGFSNLPSIAAVEGVDMIVSGNNDFSADLGVVGDYGSAAVRDANIAAIKTCADAGKLFAVGGIMDLSYLREMVAMGAARFFITGFDSEMLRDGAIAKTASFRRAFSTTATTDA